MSLLPAKDALEKLVLVFDFTSELAVGETLTGAPTVTAIVNSGVDPSPASILNGAASLNTGNLQALVPVMGGLSNCSYDIKVSCATSNLKKILELTQTLPILP